MSFNAPETDTSPADVAPLAEGDDAPVTEPSEFRTVGRHAMVYGMGIVLGKLASFLMLPVYTRFLTPADYGVLELLGMTIDVIAMIAGMGLAAGVFKFYAEFEQPSDKRDVISTVALAALVLPAATALAGILLSPHLSELILHGQQNTGYFRAFFLIYFLQSAASPAWLLLRIQQKSVLFVSLNLAKLVLSLTLNIYFVVGRRMGIEGVILSNVLVSGISAVFLVSYTFRQVGVSFSRAKLRRMARFGAPVVLWSLGSFVLTFSDRYFLNYFNNTAAVGVYGLAYRFSFLLSALAVAPFEQVWEPRRFEVAKRADAGMIYRRMFFYLSVALFGGATIIVALVRDVLQIMSAPAFWPAYQVVPLILVVTILQQWTSYCNLGIYLRDRTDLYGWSALVGVIVALALNTLLIPRFGMMGAAWATVGAYAVRFTVVINLSQAQYRISYPWTKVSVLAIIFAAVYGLRSATTIASVPVSLAFSSLLLAVAIVTVLRYVLSRSERAAIYDLALSWKRRPAQPQTENA